MVKVSNVFGDVYSGKVKDAGVFAKWKGRQYRRSYAKPSNPNTPAQRAVRASFSDGVDKWHIFNALQQQAYNPLAAGQVMSGFNLFIKRWQTMTAEQRATYVEPYTGFKQVGSGPASAEQSTNTVADQDEYTLAESPILIGSAGFTVGTGNFDPVAVVDLVRGRVDILKSDVGAITIDYQSGGRTVTGEVIDTGVTAGDVFYLDYFPVVAKSVVLKSDASAVHSFEVDIEKGKIYVVTPATYTDGGSFQWKYYTPINQVKYELFKAQTQFTTARVYSDANGIMKLAQTAEDGNRDGIFKHGSYGDIIVSNISAQDAAMDEYIKLTAL